MKNLKWRILLVASVVVLSIIFLTPTLTAKLPPWWSKFFPTDKVHLGLDLQGGMHLVLEVQADKAVESSVERKVHELKRVLRKKGVHFIKLTREGTDKIVVVLTRPNERPKFEKIVKDELPFMEIKTPELRNGKYYYQLVLKAKEAERIKKLAVSQALETIRNRIDQFGVSEPDIRPQGEDRILIQLPGIKDPQRAIELIGKTAVLEFKLVDDAVSLDRALKGELPPGDKVYPMRTVDRVTGEVRETKIVLKDHTLLTGEYVTDARVQIDNRYNTPYVALAFSPEGARIFERITAENVKKRLAIVLDGIVYSAPVIQERISGGRASITGSFSMDEARDLAIVLRAGSLPAPVKILEERTVGPSLGYDSIRSGLRSMAIGGLLVVLFMAVYYKLSGVLADIALILNIVIIMAGLAGFKATLTLPGIAGIILTIGMAVDANVLIFERIREELRVGKTPRAAIDHGYSRATLTIVDANMTTLIAAVVLFQFGTGPIRGFAVTLSLGILASMFTAIIFTRLVYDYLLQKRRIRNISI